MQAKKNGPSRILIVDDSAFNISVLGAALGEDYDVVIAKNGEEALEIAQSHDLPDLILLDIIMPGMDGHEVCRRLKRMGRTQNIPIIFITAMTEEGDETKGLEMGAVDYITKPFSLPIVKARVKTHLQLKHQNDILLHLTALDGLTGIPNRRRFDEVYSLEWKRAVRGGTPIAVVMMDIDSFKLYNDNYGHALGDDCLRKVAAKMADVIKRPPDMVARYGGEEFVAVLPETDSEGALLLAESMRQEVEAMQLEHAFSQVSKYITISVGVAAIVPTMEVTPQDLIKAADDMLYQSKKQGRNRVSIEA